MTSPAAEAAPVATAPAAGGALPADSTASGPAPTGHDALILTIFSVVWALSMLLHVYASPALTGMLHGGGGLSALASLVVAGAALALLARPTRTAPLLVASGATVVSAVADAPVVGNHWVVQAMVSLGLLAAAAHVAVRGERRGSGFSRERFAALALPLLRWSLLCFYAFAAFSKLNRGFFDPAVSCANVFADGSLRSFGLPGNLTGGSGPWPRVLPVFAAGAEVSVPLLLVLRRTRPYGIALALIFHSLVSADRNHPIGDFGSYLVASFLLFLPEAFFVDVGRWVRSRSSSLVEAVAAVVLLVTATLAVIEANGRGELAGRALEQGRWLVWIVVDLTAVVIVVGWLVRHRFRFERSTPSPLVWPPEARWLLLIPLLIVGNGLTPYLELKTGYSWNMYSNLRTVDHDSNHLLVRRTLPLSDVQADMVEIVSSSDSGLQQYADRHFALPLLQLRAYLADRPDVAITFRRGDQTITLDRAADRPELVEPVGYWEERLQAFRASTTPGAGPEVCQPTWLPAH